MGAGEPLQAAMAAPAAAVRHVESGEGLTPSGQPSPVQSGDSFVGGGPVTPSIPDGTPIPLAVRMHQEGAEINRADPRFQQLAGIAGTFYEHSVSYLRMFQRGYTLLYGPLADVAPADPQEREKTPMWRFGRIHSWRREAVALFGKLTIAKSQTGGRQGVTVLKHAIGYGGLKGKRLETANEPPRDPRSLPEIKRDFAPFREVFEAFGPEAVGVMVGGAVVEAIDPSAPGVLSPKVARVIREELGPRGEEAVLITDDLNAGIFWNHIVRECSKEQKICSTGGDGSTLQQDRLAFMLARLVEADVDIMLNYSEPPSFVLADYFVVGRRLLEQGVITRPSLEKSVVRILRMKQRIYPDHPKLQDIENTVQAMTVEELLAQKILLPAAWPVLGPDGTLPETMWPDQWIASLQASAKIPIGGFSLEGTTVFIKQARQVLEGELLAKGEIPWFLSDNPPLEVGGFDNKGNRQHAQYRAETEPVRQFTGLLDQFYPDGAPPGLVDAIFDEVVHTATASIL